MRTQCMRQCPWSFRQYRFGFANFAANKTGSFPWHCNRMGFVTLSIVLRKACYCTVIIIYANIGLIDNILSAIIIMKLVIMIAVV